MRLRTMVLAHRATSPSRKENQLKNRVTVFHKSATNNVSSHEEGGVREVRYVYAHDICAILLGLKLLFLV